MTVPAIRVLPDPVINKIAAGEVVERPRSVLKELIENAMDAGATQVDVEVVSGGRKLVAVTDNGCGMDRDDALLSIERHATSKITGVEDIERIGTLGFRGEALAAIASVSRFMLKTCRHGSDVGTEMLVSGGKLLEVRDTGGPRGTRVEVRNLFFNVPARRKFLRTQATELSHIRQYFITEGLARPDVGMSLNVDGRDLYRMAGGSSLEDRIRELFGASYRDKLRRVDHRKGEVEVTGYVSLPTAVRSDRNEQCFFVNSRPTSAAVLNYALREGYHSLVAGNRYPMAFVFLAMDPGLLDVNVHPTKREVRFRHPGEVRDAVIEAVRKALSVSGEAAAGSQVVRDGPDAATVPSMPEPRLAIQDLPPTRAFRYPRMPQVDARQGEWGKAQGSADDVPAGTPVSGENGNLQTAICNSSPWSWCRVLGQIGGLYVLLETDEGFVVMDPHAAHERVLFERFMKDVTDGEVAAQGLLAPETVELPAGDAMRVRRNIELLRHMGIGVSEFGGDTFVVDALPAYLAGVAPGSLLPDIARGLDQGGAGGGMAATRREEAVAQAACKASVKARDRMTLEEIERLVIDLASADMPYTCPHGRPTLIYTSFKELERKFGRSG